MRKMDICKRNLGIENEKKMTVSLYLEWSGFRRIARILSEMFGKKIHHQSVVQWIKNKK